MVQLPTGPTLSCPFGASPVAVIATYAGGLVPVEGATVTLFYSTLASLIGGSVTTTRTNVVGLGEACFTTGYFVQARIQKTGVNFGSGNGVQHIIGTKSGFDRFFNPTFLIIARSLPPIIPPPPPPVLPCLGSIGITPPNFTQLLSGPAMPTTIPVPFTIVKDWGATLPASIPLSIIIDDKVVTRITGQQGSNSIDILAIIRSISTTALSIRHRLSIRSDLTNCNIPAAGLDIPALIPAAPPCSGLLSILQPNFPSLLSGPSLPGSIPVPVSITGSGLPPSIPLSILVDGREVSTASGVRNGSVNIDVLSVIRSSLGAAALNTGHTLEIRPNLPDCNIPAASLYVPALIPAAITQPCTEGETKTFRCPDGTEIVIAACKRDPVTGINVWIPTGNQCALPKLKEICQIGDQQTISCPDGSVIVTANCERDPVTGRNWFVPTYKTCPIIPPKEICQIGQERKIGCPDGTEIAVEKCEKDPTTGRNRWVPTGNTCPPVEMGKVIKILTYPEGAALEAFEGQEVTVTASVVCGLTFSSGETAAFEVDGAQVAQGTTSNGTVSFKWKAIAEPSRTHKLCVSVPKSAQCPKYGSARDCKTITVSRIIPGIEAQLRKEREEYAKGLEALRQERERIRTLIQPAISVVPTAPVIPAIPFIPIIPTIPTIPTVPTGPEVPKQGKISIPSVEILPGVAFPVIVYIDGERIGSPPVMLDADPGTHSMRIELKGFTPISKKISVIAGETTQVTDLRFV